MPEPLGPVDTGWLVQITGRRPATIRTVCDRGPDGYDPEQAFAALGRVRGEVVAFSPVEVEDLFGIPANRINQRAHLGHIRPVDHDEHGRPLYALHQLHALWPDGGDGRKRRC